MSARSTYLGETKDWIKYDLPPELVGVAWKGRYRGQIQKWFALRFTGDESEIDVATRPAASTRPNSRTGAGRRSIACPKIIVPFKRAAYEQVVAELKPFVTT